MNNKTDDFSLKLSSCCVRLKKKSIKVPFLARRRPTFLFMKKPKRKSPTKKKKFAFVSLFTHRKLCKLNELNGGMKNN